MGTVPCGGEEFVGRPMRRVARKPRVELAGGVHHVFARGNGRQDIYLDDVDRHSYLFLLGRVIAKQQWRCLAFCLMDNHVHLLIETPIANLGDGMRSLHGVFAQQFNARHGRSGHLFQGRYGSVLMRTEGHVWTVAAYIARNPVVAGLCHRPDDWRWSSHRAIVEGVAAPWLDHERLLTYYDVLGGEPQRRYLEAVALS
jgi:REP-associated tyrosine transposase